MTELNFKVVIQKNEEADGYWASCPDLPGCNSIGETIAEVKQGIREAIQGYLEVISSLQAAIPTPKNDPVFLETITVST